MKNLVRFIFVFVVFSAQTRAQVFTQLDSIQVSSAKVWGVISDDGDSLALTTISIPGALPHIFLRKVNYSDISQQSAPIQLTFDTDFPVPTNPILTDHKSMVWNDEIYVTYSTSGDSGIYIFKTDMNGVRIGNIVTIEADSDDKTNDMILCNNGTSLFVLFFNPPSQHHVYEYDSDLNLIQHDSTELLNHNNIGHALFKDSKFFLATGNTFAFNSDLIITEWNSDWSPITGSTHELISSSGGDGYWFSDGIVYDEFNSRWYLAYNHIYSSDMSDSEHVELAAFNDDFTLIEKIDITDKGYTRPHLVLKNGYLYLSYDRPGTNVYLHKYMLEQVWSTEENNLSSPISVYPNPTLPDHPITVNSEHAMLSITVTDVTGKIILYEAVNSVNTCNIKLPAGIYILRVDTAQGSFINKIICT